MSITLTPETWPVFNELDSHGLLLGLPRLSGEKNASYKQRLLDVYVHRASSAYMGVINGVSRELGYLIDKEFSVDFAKNSDGTFVLAEPAIVIEENVVKLYSDYTNGTLAAEFDTWEPDSATYTIQKLVDAINGVANFTATLRSTANPNARAATLFDQSSIGLIQDEDISQFDTVSELANDHIIANSVSVLSRSLTNRVSSQANLFHEGDYYVDTQYGIIRSVTGTSPGSRVWYRYIDDTFIARSSAVIVHNLQSEIFKTRMFIQQLGNDGEYYNGPPTALGADLIGELYSVFGTKFGA